jgi:hypothetical protein
MFTTFTVTRKFYDVTPNIAFQQMSHFLPVREVPVLNLSQDAIYPGFFVVFLYSYKQIGWNFALGHNHFHVSPLQRLNNSSCHHDLLNG